MRICVSSIFYNNKLCAGCGGQHFFQLRIIFIIATRTFPYSIYSIHGRVQWLVVILYMANRSAHEFPINCANSMSLIPIYTRHFFIIIIILHFCVMRATYSVWPVLRARLIDELMCFSTYSSLLFHLFSLFLLFFSLSPCVAASSLHRVSHVATNILAHVFDYLPQISLPSMAMLLLLAVAVIAVIVNTKSYEFHFGIYFLTPPFPSPPPPPFFLSLFSRFLAAIHFTCHFLPIFFFVAC